MTMLAIEIDKRKISAIHARFRQLRSGELADNLQAQGIKYRLAWGLESYRLKEIAQEECCQGTSEERQALAEYLWQEEVRESKMLATRLYPTDSMNLETALLWGDQVPYCEIADQLCMNLLSHLPFVHEMIQRWIIGSNMQQYMALQLALRLDIAVAQAEAIAQDETKPMWLRTTANRLANNL